MKQIKLSIDQILLDAENPRIGSAHTQRDALQKVLDDQENKLYNLAKSIAVDGLSPIETMMVMREKPNSDRYISLEGNRRIAALKILTNPHQLAALQIKDALQRRFEKLAENFRRETVEPLTCAEAASREEAAPWIWRRHVGEDAGRGVVGWSGLSAARFRGTDPALQALDFVLAHGALNDQQATLLESFPITTLERLLTTVEVRKLIGVEIEDRKLKSGLPADELIKPLRKMVLDLAERQLTVSDLKNKTQQTKYVNEWSAQHKPDKSRTGESRAIDQIQSKDFKKKPALPRSKRSGRDPSDRNTLVSPRARLNISDNKVAEIFKELRSLRIDRHPNASAVLLRVFLELSVDHYMEANGIPVKFKNKDQMVERNLTHKVQAVLQHLSTQPGYSKKDFDGVVRALSVQHSPLNINLLHGYLHNRFVTPKSRDLTSSWNDAQRFFERIWP